MLCLGLLDRVKGFKSICFLILTREMLSFFSDTRVLDIFDLFRTEFQFLF